MRRFCSCATPDVSVTRIAMMVNVSFFIMSCFLIAKISRSVDIVKKWSFYPIVTFFSVLLNFMELRDLLLSLIINSLAKKDTNICL